MKGWHTDALHLLVASEAATSTGGVQRAVLFQMGLYFILESLSQFFLSVHLAFCHLGSHSLPFHIQYFSILKSNH